MNVLMLLLASNIRYVRGYRKYTNYYYKLFKILLKMYGMRQLLFFDANRSRKGQSRNPRKQMAALCVIHRYSYVIVLCPF